MWKQAAAGAAALVVAGSMFVYAQQPGSPGLGGPPRETPREMPGIPGLGGWHPSVQDMNAFADARIAALHAGLELNADQEKNWAPFEQALRELAKMRIARFSAAHDQQPSANPIERLQRRADAMTTRGTALKHLADAAAPLYQSLDDAQKHRFELLARFLRPREPHRVMWRERMREGFGNGMRGDMPGGFRNPHDFGGHGMRDPHHMGDGDQDSDYRGPL